MKMFVVLLLLSFSEKDCDDLQSSFQHEKEKEEEFGCFIWF